MEPSRRFRFVGDGLRVDPGLPGDPMPRPMMAFVEAGGLRIAYEREGSGRPIVFLHGFFGDHRVWRR